MSGRRRSFSLTHRGWRIDVTARYRHSAGNEVEWARWTACKDGRVLRGHENRGSNCPSYGDAIAAIDAIECPRTPPYEGVL